MFPSHLIAHDTNRSSRPSSTGQPAPSGVTIRRSVPADTRAIERLAALDSARAPAGDLVVAEVDGCLVAALPLHGGRPVADPFQPTAELVRLLELRLSQLLDDEREAGRRVSRRSALMRPLRALAR